MTLDLALLWRVTFSGAVVRALVNLGQRTFISVTIDRVVSLPLGGLVALGVGAYFVFQHAEQDVLPSVVGGAIVGLASTVLGLFAAYRFSLRWLGPLGDGPVLLLVAILAGALGGLLMRTYLRTVARVA